MTTAASLRDLLLEAESQIDTLRHPNIDEAKSRLHAIMVAAGLPGIEHDKIEALTIGHQSVYVTTSWSARGCACSGDYQFPVSIIDAADPIEAATTWKHQQRVEECLRRAKEAERALANANIDLTKALSEQALHQSSSRKP